jgi:hypothetical protein
MFPTFLEICAMILGILGLFTFLAWSIARTAGKDIEDAHDDAEYWREYEANLTDRARKTGDHFR